MRPRNSGSISSFGFSPSKCAVVKPATLVEKAMDPGILLDLTNKNNFDVMFDLKVAWNNDTSENQYPLNLKMLARRLINQSVDQVRTFKQYSKIKGRYPVKLLRFILDYLIWLYNSQCGKVYPDLKMF